MIKLELLPLRAIRECKVRRAAALAGALNPDVLRDYLRRLTPRERRGLLVLCSVADGECRHLAALGSKSGGDSESDIENLALQVRLNSHTLVEAYRRIQAS